MAEIITPNLHRHPEKAHGAVINDAVEELQTAEQKIGLVYEA